MYVFGGRRRVSRSWIEFDGNVERLFDAICEILRAEHESWFNLLKRKSCESVWCVPVRIWQTKTSIQRDLMDVIVGRNNVVLNCGRMESFPVTKSWNLFFAILIR